MNRETCTVIIVVAVGVANLRAQLPPRYEQSPKSTELRMIATGDRVLVPSQIAEQISQGLADGDPDVREGALYAIAGRSGILMSPTPENVAGWNTNRSALLTFRHKVEQVMVADPDARVREASVMAFVGLSMHPSNGRWFTEFDEDAVRTLVNAYHKEPVGGVRAEILKAVANEAGIPGRSVGRIDIMDNFTFFEVPSDIVEKVLVAMNRAVIRGKKVAVKKATVRPESVKTSSKKPRK